MRADLINRIVILAEALPRGFHQPRFHLVRCQTRILLEQ